MSDNDLPVLKLNSCHDCPRFESTYTEHWMGASGYVYTCTQADRTIMPNDGVEPPPRWCPKRGE